MMRTTARLCGLALSVAAEGPADVCASFLAALEPHQIHGSAEDPFSLDVRLVAGLQPDFDQLSVSKDGDALAVRGNGLSGKIGARAARLDVYGGSANAMQIAVRLACELWLAPRGGLLLHGASVEHEGRALAFLGHSGAGKTTLATRLAAHGVRVIADEVVAVRAGVAQFGASAPRVFGHPLPRRLGDGLAPPDGLPLAAIGLLSHAPAGAEPTRTRLTSAQAARALLQRVFLPAAGTRIVEGAMATVGAIARAVPMFALSLPDDDRAAHAALSIFEAA
jgi:hypothetical protein